MLGDATVTWTFEQMLSLGERLGVPVFLFILCGLGVWKVYTSVTNFFGPMVSTGFNKHIDFLDRTATTAEQAAETSRQQTVLLQKLTNNHEKSNQNHKEMVEKLNTTSDKLIGTQEKLLTTQQKLSSENLEIIQGLKDLKGNGVHQTVPVVGRPPRLPGQ